MVLFKFKLHYIYIYIYIYENQIKLLDTLYRDASKGLLTAPELNTYLKQHEHTGFTIKIKKEYLNLLETTQTPKLHYSKVSYVAEHGLKQFQIDLVCFDSSWFNHSYEYLLTCVEVFSKRADAIPLKERSQVTAADAWILSNIGIPKTIYSDQGSEFKNATLHVKGY